MVRPISWLLLLGIAAGAGCGDDAPFPNGPMVASDANGTPPSSDASQTADNAAPATTMDAAMGVEAAAHPDANATPDGRAADDVASSPDRSELDVSTRDAAA